MELSNKETMAKFTTPLYTAPEVLNETEYISTTKVDIWASGIIFYEMLTGTHPFKKEND